jgi:hypothetical protein
MNAKPEMTGSNVPQPTLATICWRSCRKLIAQIQHAKYAILAEFRQTFKAPEQMLRLALNEAEALAWQTAYPHLVFPMLATEKAQAVANWSAHQESIRHSEASQPRHV